MKIGFDFDGTIASCWINGHNAWWRKVIGRVALAILHRFHRKPWARKFIQWYCSTAKLLRRPNGLSHEVYIITSRPFWLHRATVRWLLCNNITWKYPMIMASVHSNDNEERYECKAAAINELGLSFYYEDEPDARYALQKLCGKCLVLAPEKSEERGHAITPRIQTKKFRWDYRE